MPVRMVPIEIQAPGFLGLNTQASATDLGPQWALTCDNIIFDDAGRLSARKGYTALTSTALTGSVDIEAIIHYYQNSTTDFIISSAKPTGETNYKLYQGDTTLTDITGTLTPDNGNWQFANFNDKVVGFQDGEDPIYWAGTGNFAGIHSAHTAWASSTAYVAGNAVIPTAPAQTDTYFVVAAGDAGSSAGTEPTWDYTEGNTTVDGTVTWTAVKIPGGNAVLSAFGRLWASDTDNQTLRYSALLDEKLWDSTNGGGNIDLTSVWVHGSDEIIAVSSFNNFLLIFGRNNIIAYESPDDPTALAISDVLTGIGTQARDSVQNIGTDILFLSFNGLESLGRTIQNEKMPVNDVSLNIRDEIVDQAVSATVATIKSAYDQNEGWYLLKLGDFIYCFDLRNTTEQGQARVTRWTDINPQSLYYSDRDNAMYMGRDGTVGTYSGFLDDGSTYIMSYRSQFFNFGTVAPEIRDRYKMPKQMTVTVKDGNQYTLNAVWSFDFDPNVVRGQSVVSSTTTPSEWNIAEWNVGEWSGGGTSIAPTKFYMSGYGQYMQFGFDVTINQNSISIQKIHIMAKIGRVARL